MRGEHALCLRLYTKTRGSSPHARGALYDFESLKSFNGIIPACAGSTRAPAAITAVIGDHPRMRGEHPSSVHLCYLRVGSSPHARGALMRSKGLQPVVGIIPACAGSTRATRTRGTKNRDHPRMRGEHWHGCLVLTLLTGSSPHARGALITSLVIAAVVGIIPACAGSTDPFAAQRLQNGDHPRMRGEHAGNKKNRDTVRGSSPHARGARACCCRFWRDNGIIPACAGSTIQAPDLDISQGDHPRMRGEHTSPTVQVARPTGSSPHARGALERNVLSPMRQRIIPACAGSTRMCRETLALRRDHPRMRGEHNRLTK